jgi:hypothetical protein
VNTLFEHAALTQKVATAFGMLVQADLTRENYQFLIDNAAYAGNFAVAFNLLQFDQLHTLENLQILIEHVTIAHHIAFAFTKLNQVQLFTPENRQTLIEHASHAFEIANAFVELHKGQLLTPENRQTLIKNAAYSHGIAHTFAELHRAQLLISENVNTLFENTSHAACIGYATKAMQDAGQLNQKTFDAICEQPKAALFYAEEHGGIKKSDNYGANSFVKIRQVSSLLFHGKGKNPQLHSLPDELSVKIASYCGENNALDAETCDYIADRCFPRL